MSDLGLMAAERLQVFRPLRERLEVLRRDVFDEEGLFASQSRPDEVREFDRSASAREPRKAPPWPGLHSRP